MPTSFVDGSAYDVDAPAFDHDSFDSNVGASTKGKKLSISYVGAPASFIDSVLSNVGAC